MSIGSERMTERRTLPRQRADETRRSIIAAAERVFGRKGYGEGTVDDIIAEAGISRGAFYHHFANKEEVFRELLRDHVKDELVELSALAPGASLRDVVRGFVEFQAHHLLSERESGALSLEFWAYASREARARESVAAFHLGIRETLERVVRLGQGAGVVRSDVEAEVGAYLLLALYEGIAVLQALDKESMDLQRLSGAWADLIERFLTSKGEGVQD